MTESESNLSDTWEKLEWSALTHESVRSDIATLLKYRDDFDSVSPTYLFWELYRPSLLYDDESKASAPNLSGEVKELVLELLQDMYQRHRVPYEPDRGVSDISEYFRISEDYELGDTELTYPNNLKNLLVHIHVAAARAFVLKQYDGYSEEVVDCLKEVNSSWKLLSFSGYSGSSSGHDTDNYEVFHSIDAISALALVELARVDRNQGLYADALHKMAEAEERYKNASVLVMGPVDRWPLGGARANTLPLATIDEFLTGMHLPAEYVLETFNLLKSSRYNGDWTQVAHDCEQLAGAFFLSFPKYISDLQGDDMDEDEDGTCWAISEEYVWPEEPRWAGGVLAGDYWEISQTLMAQSSLPDEKWGSLKWREFWISANVWASTKINPTDLVEFFQRNRETEAETRLKNYFFGSNWSYLPERAQKSLISADSILNSGERKARREAIDNELRIATEEMCYLIIWQPLSDTKTPPLEFIREKLKLDERPERSDPNLLDYTRICRARWFREFLNQQNLDRDDVKFLTKQLPEDMSQLRSERNTAEHKTGMSTPPDSPQSFYRGFLGIGRKGVLTELARIGRKLQSHPDTRISHNPRR